MLSLVELDLEAGSPEDCTIENQEQVEEGCFPTKSSIFSDDELAECSKIFTVINFLRVLLGTLWFYMVYAMIRFTIKHSNEKGLVLLITLQAILLMMVTPYFGLAAKILKDCEKKGSDPPDDEDNE